MVRARKQLADPLRLVATAHTVSWWAHKGGEGCRDRTRFVHCALRSTSLVENAVHKYTHHFAAGMEEVVQAHGHEHVAGAHASTLELTTDDYLTPAGDCILGIEADRTPADFDSEFVGACRDETAEITLVLEADGHSDTVTGQGHLDLEFTNERSFVARTSTYVDDRTVLVDADKAAADVDRDLVDALAAGADLTATFRVE